jgi:hypothetical protein
MRRRSFLLLFFLPAQGSSAALRMALQTAENTSYKFTEASSSKEPDSQLDDDAR